MALTASAVLATATAAQATFTLNLQLPGGATASTVSANSVVTLEVWGTVSPGPGSIQDAFFGVSNGGSNGNLSVVTLASPFNGISTNTGTPTTSSSGTLSGANNSVSVGLGNNAAADGWVFARSTSMTDVSGSGNTAKLGTLTYTVSSSPANGDTLLSMVTRQNPSANTLVVPALWKEGATTFDGSTASTYLNGTGVTLTVGAVVVTQHIAGNTPFGGYDGSNAAEAVNLNDLNAVLNNLGTTNAAGYAWPRSSAQTGIGSVGLNDLNAVLNNLGTSTAGGAPLINGNPEPTGVASAALVAVPEPTTLGLVGLVGGLAMARRRKI